jgi:hypothetical protein
VSANADCDNDQWSVGQAVLMVSLSALAVHRTRMWLVDVGFAAPGKKQVGANEKLHVGVLKPD